MNKDMLKGQIRSLGMTQEDVAKKIGISLSRFNAKINETDNAEFSIGEAKRLKQVLSLSAEQLDRIFME